MPKKETLEIQNSIQELGTKLGFISKKEERLHSREHYSPSYDVVWYLDLEKHFNIKELEKFFENSPEIFNRIKTLPFAAFEIEGASTSSKNQISNFANLYGGYFLYNFVIVNNYGANGENDTYRRGIKIKQYFSNNNGDKNLFFFDSIQLKKSLENLKINDNKISVPPSDNPKRKTSGGETISVKLYEKIKSQIYATRFTIKHNYQPWIYDIKYKMMKEAAEGANEFAQFYFGQLYYEFPDKRDPKEATMRAQSLYVPKLDLCLGFNAPKGFSSWLSSIADTFGPEISHYPILYALKNEVNELFIPLIGIEIETSINKHLNGGIYNLSNDTYVGIVVTKEEAFHHIEFFKKELGITNVTAYCIKD